MLLPLPLQFVIGFVAALADDPSASASMQILARDPQVLAVLALFTVVVGVGLVVRMRE